MVGFFFEFYQEFDEVVEFVALVAVPALAEVEVVSVQVVVVARVEWEVWTLGEGSGDNFVRHGYGRVFGVGLGYELVEFGYESFGFLSG